MVQDLGEVPEAQAEGKVKDTYEDIGSTLGLPYVPHLFRSLAICPDYLLLAWRMLKPNVETRFFEQSAVSLRTTSIDLLEREAITSTASVDGATRELVTLIQLASSRQMLVVTALRAATNGQLPRLSELSSEQKRRTDKPPLPAISIFSPPGQSPANIPAEGLEEVLGVCCIEPTIETLARVWPKMRNVSETWLRLSKSPEYHSPQRALRRLADEFVTGFPYRMDIYPHALRHAGLSEQSIDNIRQALDAHYRCAADMVHYSSFLRLHAVGTEQPAGALLEDAAV